MQSSKTLPLYWSAQVVGGLCFALLPACGDDGNIGEADATTESMTSAGSAGTQGGPTTNGNDSANETQTPQTEGSAGDESTGGTTGVDPDGGMTGDDDSSGSGDTGPGPDSVCPPGPFMDSPLPTPDMDAPAIGGTSMVVHGMGLVEGPVWIDGALYLSKFEFSDTYTSSILRFTPPSTLEVAFDEMGTNGMALDADGMLLAATHDDGSISRIDPMTGDRTSLNVQYNGVRLNSPNDLVLAADGSIYFSDPNYQAPMPNPQPMTGLYRRTPAGEVELIDDTLTQPNGVALSPDQSVLYVGSQGPLVRYTVMADGSVAGPAEPFGDNVSGVDGMAVDCAGNIYATVHGDGIVEVLDPRGQSLGTITVAPSVTNAAFGGPDQTTLYITAGDINAGDAIYSVELNIPGYPY